MFPINPEPVAPEIITIPEPVQEPVPVTHPVAPRRSPRTKSVPSRLEVTGKGKSYANVVKMGQNLWDPPRKRVVTYSKSTLPTVGPQHVCGHLNRDDLPHNMPV